MLPEVPAAARAGKLDIRGLLGLPGRRDPHRSLDPLQPVRGHVHAASEQGDRAALRPGSEVCPVRVPSGGPRPCGWGDADRPMGDRRSRQLPFPAGLRLPLRGVHLLPVHHLPPAAAAAEAVLPSAGARLLPAEAGPLRRGKPAAAACARGRDAASRRPSTVGGSAAARPSSGAPWPFRPGGEPSPSFSRCSTAAGRNGVSVSGQVRSESPGAEGAGRERERERDRGDRGRTGLQAPPAAEGHGIGPALGGHRAPPALRSQGVAAGWRCRAAESEEGPHAMRGWA